MMSMIGMIVIMMMMEMMRNWVSLIYMRMQMKRTVC